MAGNSTFIQLPRDVTNPLELRRFLDKLVEQVDIAFGNRGDNAFATDISLVEIATILNNHETRILSLEDIIPGLVSDVRTLKDGELVVKTLMDLTLGTLTETVLCDCINNSITITLPPAANIFNNSRSKTISIAKIDITDNIVNIIPSGSELILGESSVDLIKDSEIINLITDGTNWYLGA